MYTQSIFTNNTNDHHVIQKVQNILTNAITKNASDIHFEYYENSFRIRFRIDGLLFEYNKLELHLAQRICTRIKIMAELDIAEKRIPQDGRFSLEMENNKKLNFRVSTCPTLFGEKIVVRILKANQKELAISQLGFEPEQENLFIKAIQQAQGMILVTGPTGSGKTMTLYNALARLNQTERNISSIEDPIEIYMNGINQVNINLKAGLNFANVLRAFLRQDPDIIMIGEMRDLETAEIAIKAAQTGHLVLSTLHTNNAVEALTRLKNMGLPTYNIATSLSLIIAQRLVRKLCQHCKKADHNAIKIIQEQFPHWQFSADNVFCHTNQGCEQCQQGFSGRTGVFECLEINANISEAILNGKHSLELLDIAKKQRMIQLYESGIKKVINGETSLAEVYRVIKGDYHD